jgi:hypothetical protein
MGYPAPYFLSKEISENGQMAAVPWFAVYKNGVVMQRLNGAFIETVCY